MAEKKRGLGRGLGALISSAPGPAEQLTDDPKTSPATEKNNGETKPRAQTPANDKPANAGASNKPTAGKRTSERVTKASGATRSPKRSNAASDTGESPEADSSPLKTAETASVRKSRPVDMFFTPGPSEEGAAKAVQTKGAARSASRGSKRPQMPDLIGKDRARSAPTPDDAPEQAQAPSTVSEDVSRETLVPVPGASFAEIPVKDIHPNRKQPRQVFDEDDMAELVHSIKEVGLLQPIVVRPSEDGAEESYELVMGERRWRATQEAGLDTIPAIVRQTTNEDLLRDALLENLHRSQLNPLEEAAAYQQLLEEFGCTQEELSSRIGRSRPQISNTIRLMKLPPLVQRRVAAGVLSQGHARALLALSDAGQIERLAQRIVAEGLSVRATEEIVAMSDGVEEKRRATKPRNNARHERLDYLATSLSDRLDTNVKITLGAKKGKVAIEFASVDDLNRIMAVIAPDTVKN